MIPSDIEVEGVGKSRLRTCGGVGCIGRSSTVRD